MTTKTNRPVEIGQGDRDAAKALLDRLRIREHETGNFRSWDETVEAFARHAASAREEGFRAGVEAAAGIAEGFAPTGYMSDREREYCRDHGSEISEAIRSLSIVGEGD